MGCRARRSADDLLRIVRSGEGAAAAPGQLAVGRSMPGRGAWICRSTALDCLDLAVRRKALGRALRTELAADAAGRLRGYLAERARL